MPTTTIRGTTLYHDEVGEGPPLLVCHGGPGMTHDVYRTLDPLADQHRVVYWDHRGHGRSGRPARETLTIAGLADDGAELAATLGIDRAAVLGHSAGGWVAQEMALRHPDLVGALVLVATTAGQLGPDESPDEDQGPPMPPDLLEILTSGPETDEETLQMFVKLAPYFAGTADPAPLLDALDGAAIDADSGRAIFEDLARWSSTARLPAVACPSLLVGGDADVFCSFPQQQRIARRIPGAELIRFAGVGHFPWFEEPDRFFDTVGCWLAEQGF